MTVAVTEIEYTRPWMAPYQTKILDSQKRFTVVEASTKTGKTASHIVWLFEQALDGKEGYNYWWVAPIFKQAKIAFKRLKRQISEKRIIDRANETELYIRLINGAEIHFKSADNPDGLFGEDVYAAVFDEFTRAKESAWFALRSTLTATGGPCKFIGNYTGSTNWGHKLSKKANREGSDYEYFRITAFDAVEAGILDASEIEQAREDLPLSVFEALYLAKGSSDDDVLFSEAVLESFFENAHVKPVGNRYLTADVALHGSDRFVICVWYGWCIVEIIVIDKCDAKQAEDKLREIATAHRIPLHNIVYDADGLGSFLKGYLKPAQSFHNGAKAVGNENYANIKAQCFFQLSVRLSRGEARCMVDRYKEDIQRELEVIKKHNVEKGGKLTVTPKKAVKELLGFSPDFAESVMMREYFELPISKLPQMI